ncbi:MAG: hypothetical protein R3F07_20760 [Opitutaceae bacterium]
MISKSTLFLAIVLSFSSGLCGPSGSVKTLLDRLDDIPVAEGRILSFYLVGRLRAVVEDMIFYSSDLPVCSEIGVQDSRAIRSTFESAAYECRAIVKKLEVERGKVDPLEYSEVWKQIDVCIALTTSIAEGEFARDALFRAWESTSWAELDGNDSQYLNCGYGLEKLTRTLRLEGLILSLGSDRSSLLAQVLGLRKVHNEQAILASLVRVVDAGDLDEFLQFGIDSAAASFSRLFGQDFPSSWPVGRSGFPM